MKNILILSALFAAPVWAASTCAEMNAFVAEKLQAMQDSAGNGRTYDENATSLVTELKRFASEHAAESWTCDYAQTEENHIFNVRASADGKLRAYSWDTMTGGTMRVYFSLLQYRDNDGNTHIVEANADVEKDETWGEGNSGFVTHIYDVDLGEHGTAYFLIQYHQGDTRNKAYTATLYRIRDDKLEKLPWIIEDGTETTSTGFAYDTAQGTFPQKYPFMQYDSASNTLSYPETLPRDRDIYMEMTTKRVQFRFDGQRFVMVK